MLLSSLYHWISKYKELFLYVIVGILTTIVSLVSYHCSSLILDIHNPLQLQVANILSWIVSVTFAYITNRLFVFNSTDKKWLKEAFRFYCSRITTLLLDMILMYILVFICFYNDKFAKVLVQIILIIGNYLLSKFLVFKP